MAQQTTTSPSQADILLESGTNELEVLVFRIGAQPYGVNVAKVREVIHLKTITASPGQPRCVKGVFNLRGVVLPLIDLHMYLNIEPIDADIKSHRIIVTEFNGNRASFQAESVDQIHRLSWQQIRPVPKAQGSHHFCVTGITEINDELVLMLDFESIFDHIAMQDKMHVEKVDNPLGIDRESQRVMLVEDSQFIRNLIEKVLIASGYVHVETHNNGLAAWQALEQIHASQGRLPCVVVTDIEMPQMDGLSLTRHIKEHSDMGRIPVVLFSSLITPDTLHKGQQVGADKQIAKPQLPELVGIIDNFMNPKSEAAA